MIYLETGRTFGCCCFWCLFFAEMHQQEDTELLGNVFKSSLHCIGFCHEFCSQPYAINNDIFLQNLQQIHCLSQFHWLHPVRFSPLAISVGRIGTRKVASMRCPPLRENHESLGIHIRFSSLVPIFDTISPEMMNFFWDISLTMMIMSSQWLGLWVDPRHPRHDERKYPSKKGCLLNQGVVEKLCCK